MRYLRHEIYVRGVKGVCRTAGESRETEEGDTGVDIS